MRKLIDGIQTFKEKEYPRKRELFQKLKGGQSPETLFITCSDSRIDPSLITMTDPGELFIIRNAGNLVLPFDDQSDLGTAATIEYAVKALGVQDLVVCGHTFCGAMGALVNPAACKGLPTVSNWVERAARVRARVEERHGEVAGDRLLDVFVQENVLLQLENLETHPAVSEALAAGSLKLHGWVYDIANGEVLNYSHDEDVFAAVGSSDSRATT